MIAEHGTIIKAHIEANVPELVGRVSVWDESIFLDAAENSWDYLAVVSPGQVNVTRRGMAADAVEATYTVNVFAALPGTENLGMYKQVADGTIGVAEKVMAAFSANPTVGGQVPGSMVGNAGPLLVYQRGGAAYALYPVDIMVIDKLQRWLK